MGRIRSKREKKLQRKLIPVNIVVCILSLIAALSLFLTPILKIDVGKMLRSDELQDWVFSSDSSPLSDLVDNDDFAPILNNMLSGILNDMEGEISISAVSAFKVMNSKEKADKVLDDLFFGDNALVTKLINSLVDGLAGIFDNEGTKAAVQEAIISALTDQIINSLGDNANAGVISENVNDIVEIFNKLGDDGSTPEAVANEIVDKMDELLGSDNKVSDEERENFVNQIQELYDDAQKEVGEGEKVDLEAIICVAAAKNIGLDKLNLGNLFNGSNGGTGESVHKNSVRDELNDEGDPGDPNDPGNSGDPGDPNDPGNSGDPSDPGDDQTGDKEDEDYPTTYKELLERMGLDDNSKDSLKLELRNSLSDSLKNMLKDAGIYDFLGYYEYVFYAMLIFIVPWLILFLFSLFHLLARNKRFMMWYVKLLCWIPSIFWLAIKLFPVVAKKFFPNLVSGTAGQIIKVVLSGVSSFTWINGLCYVLLWLVSIFWAFPIKHKIRKERRHPKFEEDEDEDDYEEETDYEEDYDYYSDY